MAFSQINYREGYVITNNNDTVRGLINLKFPAYNQAVCSFKTGDTAEPTAYSPNEIKGYRVDEKYYVAKNIDLKTGSKTVFLEFLVKGMLNLYYYFDEAESYYFFEDEQGNMNALSRKPDVVIDSKIHKDNRYVGRLKYLFRDFEPVAQNAEQVQFTSNSMIRIAEQYHDAYCTTGEDCIIFKNQKPSYDPVRLKVSVYAGMQTVDPGLETGRFMAPAVGAQFDFGFPRQTGSWSIPVNLYVFRSAKYGAERNIAKTLMPVQIGLKYTYRTDKELQPYLGGGFTPVTVSLSNKDYRMETTGMYFAAGVSYSSNKTTGVFLEFCLDSKMPFTDGNALKNMIKAGFMF